jgi:L-ribulose-5-phosphate 3-epimerase
LSGSLAVCSWSLRPASPADLVAKLGACGINRVQLALGPIRESAWDERETVARLSDAGIHAVSGMMATEGEDYSTLDTIRVTGGIRPDETWRQNLAAAQQEAELASRLGLDLVTFHAGFIPHDSDDHEWFKLIDRLRILADVFSRHGIRLGLETGQESASSLKSALEALQRPSVGVNFDPANMILYGMGDPVNAIRQLADRVFQIHIKDAVRTKTPGTWGEEVPAGTGQVDWDAFFEVVRDRLPDRNLVIEREAGDQRIEDVRLAARMVRARADWIQRS